MLLIKGVNKCNLHLILEHLDPGLNLPVKKATQKSKGLRKTLDNINLNHKD